MPSEAEIAVLFLSLRVAAVAVLALLPAAIGVAWLLSRRHFPGKIVVEALVTAPLVLPPVVTGYLLLLCFGRRGLLGEPLAALSGWSMGFHWTGAALAAAVVSFPLATRAIRLSLDGIEPRLEDAARSLGAGPARVFLSVSLPLALPGILTGALLAFARSLGEFGATITFVGNIEGQTRTLPLAIYTALQGPTGEAAALRLVLISLVLAVGSLVLSEYLVRRTPQRLERA